MKQVASTSEPLPSFLRHVTPQITLAPFTQVNVASKGRSSNGVNVSEQIRTPSAAGSQGGEEPFALGQVLMVKVADELWVANLVGQEGMGAKAVVPPVRYEAIVKGLERLAEFAQQNGASIHMPRIGCGLAGGNWEEIELIERTLLAKSVAVTVFDFEPA